MLVIGGRIRLDPAKREAAIAAATEMMEATRQETGCVSYVFSADFADPGLFHLFEEWETAENLAAHGQTEHMATFQAKMADFGITERSIHVYDCSNKKQL